MNYWDIGEADASGDSPSAVVVPSATVNGTRFGGADPPSCWSPTCPRAHSAESKNFFWHRRPRAFLFGLRLPKLGPSWGSGLGAASAGWLSGLSEVIVLKTGSMTLFEWK